MRSSDRQIAQSKGGLVVVVGKRASIHFGRKKPRLDGRARRGQAPLHQEQLSRPVKGLWIMGQDIRSKMWRCEKLCHGLLRLLWPLFR